MVKIVLNLLLRLIKIVRIKTLMPINVIIVNLGSLWIVPLGRVKKLKLKSMDARFKVGVVSARNVSQGLI